MRRVVHPVQTFVVNPLVKLGFDVGISAPRDALLETTRRTSGKPRRTPVCDCEDTGRGLAGVRADAYRHVCP